jgi:hypothetical protein
MNGKSNEAACVPEEADMSVWGDAMQVFGMRQQAATGRRTGGEELSMNMLPLE